MSLFLGSYSRKSTLASYLEKFRCRPYTVNLLLLLLRHFLWWSFCTSFTNPCSSFSNVSSSGETISFCIRSCGDLLRWSFNTKSGSETTSFCSRSSGKTTIFYTSSANTIPTSPTFSPLASIPILSTVKCSLSHPLAFPAPPNPHH